MSRIIHSEDDDDDDVGSQSSSSLSSPSKSLQQDPIPTKIPLSTSIILEKITIRTTSEIIKSTEGSTAGGHVSNNSLDNKIMIRFVPIGSTPSIQPRVFKISATQTVSTLNRFCVKIKVQRCIKFVYSK